MFRREKNAFLRRTLVRSVVLCVAGGLAGIGFTYATVRGSVSPGSIGIDPIPAGIFAFSGFALCVLCALFIYNFYYLGKGRDKFPEK